MFSDSVTTASMWPEEKESLPSWQRTHVPGLSPAWVSWFPLNPPVLMLRYAASTGGIP